MPARGSRRDSRSRRSPSYRRRSPSYRRDDRRGGGGDRGRSRRGSRSRSGGRGGSRYSPPPRRTPPRDRRFSRSRSRREREAQKRREAEKKKMEKRIPPPAVRGPDKPQITEEHKANSVEFNGRYYATIDFTPPNSGGDSAGQKARIQTLGSVKRPVDHSKSSEEKEFSVPRVGVHECIHTELLLLQSGGEAEGERGSRTRRAFLKSEAVTSFVFVVTCPPIVRSAEDALRVGGGGHHRRRPRRSCEALHLRHGPCF